MRSLAGLAGLGIVHGAGTPPVIDRYPRAANA